MQTIRTRKSLLYKIYMPVYCPRLYNKSLFGEFQPLNFSNNNLREASDTGYNARIPFVIFDKEPSIVLSINARFYNTSKLRQISR